MARKKDALYCQDKCKLSVRKKILQRLELKSTVPKTITFNAKDKRLSDRVQERLDAFFKILTPHDRHDYEFRK